MVYNHFPDNYINDVRGWAFDNTTIVKNKGKLLTLDIDFGSNCSLNCPACFRKNSSLDGIKHELTLENLKGVIKQAKLLGLQSVKFLGAGEPFENSELLDFLYFLKEESIIPLIFTKGHVIGDDNLAFKYFSKNGVRNSIDLVKELNKCDASILIGFNSFNDAIQAKMVGGDKDYTFNRNRALKLLVDHGFNEGNPTRLALINSPITIWNVEEALEIYKWARIRNLYCVITPSMITGKVKDKVWEAITPPMKMLTQLYTDIYKFNIERNLQKVEQIIQEGIASYAGGHPCNQVSNGLYITLNGIVLSCPGSENLIEGNIWECTLEEIWLKSSNYKRSGVFNCGCIVKEGKTLPMNFIDSIREEILQCQ